MYAASACMKCSGSVHSPSDLFQFCSTGNVSGDQWTTVEDENGEMRAVGGEGSYTLICDIKTVADVQLLREGRREAGWEEEGREGGRRKGGRKGGRRKGGREGGGREGGREGGGREGCMEGGRKGGGREAGREGEMGKREGGREGGRKGGRGKQ